MQLALPVESGSAVKRMGAGGIAALDIERDSMHLIVPVMIVPDTHHLIRSVWITSGCMYPPPRLASRSQSPLRRNLCSHLRLPLHLRAWILVCVARSPTCAFVLEDQAQNAVSDRLMESRPQLLAQKILQSTLIMQQSLQRSMGKMGNPLTSRVPSPPRVPGLREWLLSVALQPVRVTGALQPMLWRWRRLTTWRKFLPSEWLGPFFGAVSS